MNLLKGFLVFIPALMAVSCFGQQKKGNDKDWMKEKTAWKYEVKKKSAREYQLIFHLDIKEQGWFLWSLNPGGDGNEIAPAFDFDKNPRVKLKGTVTEKGKLTETTIEGIGKVRYMTGKVDYIQEVTVTGKTKITGRHEYQMCNDKRAQPPRTKEFSFEIK